MLSSSEIATAAPIINKKEAFLSSWPGIGEIKNRKFFYKASDIVRPPAFVIIRSAASIKIETLFVYPKTFTFFVDIRGNLVLPVQFFR